MSALEQHEILACPLHGDNVGVERAKNVAQPWACSSCVLVFEGTTSEWLAMARLRAAFAENQAG